MPEYSMVDLTVAIERHNKFDIATRQLETAIGLLLSGRDKYSAITLAGAADTILSNLVLKAGKEPFVDYARRAYEAERGRTPPRGKFTSHMNKVLGINTLKHMDEGDSEEVELDIDESVEGAILKAIANYKELVDEEPSFIKAFMKWHWDKTSPERRAELMKGYENRPQKMKDGDKAKDK